MSDKTNTLVHIIQKGAVREETWEWCDLEALCRSGRLPAETLVFVPEANDWVQASDTELAPYFASRESVADDAPPGVADLAEIEEQYEQVIQQIAENPDDVAILLQAGEISLALGQPKTALKHFQAALENHPYHPRVVQEAKRIFPPRDWKSLRFFERAAPFWEDPAALFGYPFRRGVAYVLLLTAVLSSMFWIPGMWMPALGVLYLFGFNVMRSVAQGSAKPPLWHGVISQPAESLLKPLLVVTIVSVELYAPFLVLAYAITFFGLSVHDTAFNLIQRSPAISVVMFTASLFYLPAVFVLTIDPQRAARHFFDPRIVISAIKKMEREYIASVAFVLLLVLSWGMVKWTMDSVPVARVMVPVGVGIYVLSVVGFALGRMHSRFVDQMNCPREKGGSGVE